MARSRAVRSALCSLDYPDLELDDILAVLEYAAAAAAQRVSVPIDAA
jgi:uncharacterized protein (DUF433 family)